MRVISGYLKGRELLGYNVETTRPTMSRVKESMFASIQNYIDNSIVLDLFCGTGSLGIEALSMGASRCYFVDNNKDILRYLNKNINNLGINSKSIIVSKDYRDSLLYFKNNFFSSFSKTYLTILDSFFIPRTTGSIAPRNPIINAANVLTPSNALFIFLLWIMSIFLYTKK